MYVIDTDTDNPQVNSAPKLGPPSIDDKDGDEIGLELIARTQQWEDGCVAQYFQLSSQMDAIE